VSGALRQPNAAATDSAAVGTTDRDAILPIDGGLEIRKQPQSGTGDGDYRQQNDDR
jgi:hypothetical protein